MNHKLTPNQVAEFRTKGFLSGLPVFGSSELEELNAGLKEITDLLEPGESTKEIREWHEASRFLFDICMHDRILDYVDDLIGPNFFMWASNFFIKPPRTDESVTWHQDAYYWPLTPRASVTVWLAFDNVDENNGAMEVIPGSHADGIFEHRRLGGAGSSVLDLECDTSGFNLDTVERVCLNAGQISIHSDQLIHGSPANPSDRRRAGLTVRYSPTNVVCDLDVNPHFRTYMARGVDTFGHNPKGEVPTQRFGRLNRKHRSVEEAGADVESRFWSKEKS